VLIRLRSLVRHLVRDLAYALSRSKILDLGYRLTRKHWMSSISNEHHVSFMPSLEGWTVEERPFFHVCCLTVLFSVSLNLASCYLR
jgi:hypothetical protein